MRRFYIPPGQIGNKESLITGTDAHHLRDVLRLQLGQRIVVFDGTGREFEAQILRMDRQQVVVSMKARMETDPPPALHLTIAQGYLKDKKMDGVVRQLTELGVGRWIPFLSKRAIPVPDEKRLQGRYRRWQKISLESLKQCGRSHVMEIDPLSSFDDVLKRSEDYDLKIIFWEDVKSHRLADRVSSDRPKSVLLVVGPEGGFGPEEISAAVAEGFKTVGMGPRTLKAETAAVAAAVMAQCVFGDMG